MRSSSQEDEAVVKQGSSKEDEPEVQQRCRDQNEAVAMQRCGNEAKESPGLDHPGQNKKERQRQNDGNIR